MKNPWLIEEIQKLEERKFFGKVTLNFNNGDVPKIKVEEDVLKPKDGKGGVNGKLEGN